MHEFEQLPGAAWWYLLFDQGPFFKVIFFMSTIFKTIPVSKALRHVLLALSLKCDWVKFNGSTSMLDFCYDICYICTRYMYVVVVCMYWFNSARFNRITQSLSAMFINVNCTYATLPISFLATNICLQGRQNRGNMEGRWGV